MQRLMAAALLLTVSSALAQSDETKRWIERFDQQWRRIQQTQKPVWPPPPAPPAVSGDVPQASKDYTGERFVAVSAWGCGTLDDLLMMRKVEISVQARSIGISGPDILPNEVAINFLRKKSPSECREFPVGQAVTVTAIEGLPEFIRLHIPDNKRPYIVDAMIPLTGTKDAKPRLIKIADSAVKVIRVKMEKPHRLTTGECWRDPDQPREWCDWVHLSVYGYNTTDRFLHYYMVCEAYDGFGRLLGRSERLPLLTTRGDIASPFFLGWSPGIIKTDRVAAARVDCHAEDVSAVVSPDND
jgi:hypothetical protein